MIAALSVAPRFPDCVDWQKMRTVAVWTAFVLAYSSSPLVASTRYIDPISGQSGNNGDIVEKRVDLTEPTCEELRAMWRNTKRQSRAAKTNTGYSLYPDPFTYNMWKSYSERAKPPLNYRGRYTGRPRNRAGGNAPVYGKIVHKVPAGSRLRNGMRQFVRPIEKISPFYGTINPYSSSTRRHLSSFRTIGGGPPPMPQVPQAGRFQHLKELLQAERARELKELHRAEENEGKTAFEDAMDDELNMQQNRKQFLKPTLRIPTKVNYEFGQGRYTSNVPNIGQAWSRSEPQSREYMLR
ncbi:uncharacterized protein LOC122402128 isoform X1 [Colletes gigas]|uniref:uncharacterized protein LOC122402128 isoform X1 n=2 Tax=Colletes gigas TaxID=935657 RepID=UPI001C9B5549|nr:uncharacterized protein LOC122402128 isoform X1 [Colletes gigas]